MKIRNFLKKVFLACKKEQAILIIIFLISFLIRLYFVFADNLPLSGDQITYDKLALSLLQDHEFSLEKGQPTAYTTPLYPFFLSIIYFFFGHSYLAVKVFQALLGSIVCLTGYFIAKEVFSKPVACLTFSFMAIHYFFIKYSSHLATENLFIFWVALSTLFLIKFCKRPSYPDAILFGLFCSLATLTRSAYFLFPFMVIMILWIAPKFIKFPYRKLIKFYIVIILFTIFPISIWTIRNFCLLKSFVPLATEAGHLVYSCYNPPQGKIFDVGADDELVQRYLKMPEAEGSQFLLKHTILSIKKEPSKIYKYIPLKIMYFCSPFEWAAFKASGAYNFSTAFILPLSFLGVILAFRKRPSYLNFILLLPLAYFVLITIAIVGVPRTRLPVEPYLIIFASFFVYYLYNRSRFKIRVISAISIWYFFNYLLYLNSGAVKIIARSIVRKIGLW